MSEQSENQSESQGEKEMGKKFQKERPKLPRHAILHRLRAHIEHNHRFGIFRTSVRFFGPACVSLANIPKLWMVQIEACCNKSLPIYIWPDKSLSPGFLKLLPIALHNYLYRTWYVNFRAELLLARTGSLFDFQSGWLTGWSHGLAGPEGRQSGSSSLFFFPPVFSPVFSPFFFSFCALVASLLFSSFCFLFFFPSSSVFFPLFSSLSHSFFSLLLLSSFLSARMRTTRAWWAQDDKATEEKQYARRLSNASYLRCTPSGSRRESQHTRMRLLPSSHR